MKTLSYIQLLIVQNNVYGTWLYLLEVPALCAIDNQFLFLLCSHLFFCSYFSFSCRSSFLSDLSKQENILLHMSCYYGNSSTLWICTYCNEIYVQRDFQNNCIIYFFLMAWVTLTITLSFILVVALVIKCNQFLHYFYKHSYLAYPFLWQYCWFAWLHLTGLVMWISFILII